MNRSAPRPLETILLHILRLRLYLPLITLTIVVLATAGHLAGSQLVERQRVIAHTLSATVDDYLDQAGRVLNTVARTAELAPRDALQVSMQATWEAYEYFDRIYLLDTAGFVSLLAPDTPRFRGMDMSNQPFFTDDTGESSESIIAYTAITWSSELPVVHMVRLLNDGDRVVGELDLCILQDVIDQETRMQHNRTFFITDNDGNVLAHSDFDYVVEQMNLSQLPAVQRGLVEDSTFFYRNAGQWVLGSTARIDRTDWVVVTEVPFWTMYGIYGTTSMGILGLVLVISISLVWSLRMRIRKDIVAPLAQLRLGANALADGDYARGDRLVENPVAFEEIDALGHSFRQMSRAIQFRQTALQASEERLRQVVQNMPVMMVALNSDREIIIWNRECERVTGFSAEEIANKPRVGRLLYPDRAELEVVRAQWDNRNDTFRDWRLKLSCKDDTQKTISWSNISELFPIPGWALWAIGVDITEQVKAEEERKRLLAEVQAQAQKVQLIMDTVPEGVLLLDANGKVQLANPIAESMLRLLSDAGTGDTLTQIGNRARSELLAPLPEGLWHKIEYRDDHYQALARPVDPGAHDSGWVMVIRDVTQEQLVQQHAERQQRLASVGQLAAGIAHDFNNIMAVIILYAQMIARTETLSQRAQERIETINSQAQHASKLIEQILDFSRRAVIERHPLDLHPLLKEEIDLLTRTLPDNIRIEFNVASHDDTDTFIVNADPTRVQQAVMNLVLNARDAMTNGGILSISLHPVLLSAGEVPPVPGMQPGMWLELAIVDTGHGIPPDVLPHIFDPFFTTKPPGKGTGLGLAQVHGIVKSHDGEITATSEVGKGTTVTIYLPAIKQPSVPATISEALNTPHGYGETILVVEDNPATREALQESLDLLRYRVLTAQNGRKALDVLARYRDTIALIISDMVMPEMGGVELLEALKRQGVRLPVIILTGHPLNEEPKNLNYHSQLEWITKPVTLEKLTHTIARTLGKSTT